jgi:exopolyphosphatase
MQEKLESSNDSLQNTPPHQGKDVKEDVQSSEFSFDEHDLDELRGFLYKQREQLQNRMHLSPQTKPDVHIVLGNESADMDSIISSIVRAYQLFLVGENDALYLPYINIPREELSLRKDVQYLFEGLGISAENLSFIDDPISLALLNQANLLKLHLVDHNELNPDQSYLVNTVVDIIDHHADAKINYPALKQKTIKVIGSCTCLVANEMLKVLPIEKMPKALAGLILAPILIDTSNLKSKEKTTSEDIRINNILEERIGDKMPSNYYETLRLKKEDTSGLSHKLLLLKDFKKFNAGEVTYGMSTLVSSKGFSFENLDELLPDFEAISEKKRLGSISLVNAI